MIRSLDCWHMICSRLRLRIHALSENTTVAMTDRHKWHMWPCLSLEHGTPHSWHLDASECAGCS